MLGSHDTVAIKPPSKAVRHREGGCDEAISKARVSGWDAAQVAVRCIYLMGRRGAMRSGRAKGEQYRCEQLLWDKVAVAGAAIKFRSFWTMEDRWPLCQLTSPGPGGKWFSGDGKTGRCSSRRRKAVAAKERLCDGCDVFFWSDNKERVIHAHSGSGRGVELIWGFYSAPSWEPCSAVRNARYRQSRGAAGGPGMPAISVPRLGNTQRALL